MREQIHTLYLLTVYIEAHYSLSLMDLYVYTIIKFNIKSWPCIAKIEDFKGPPPTTHVLETGLLNQFQGEEY